MSREMNNQEIARLLRAISAAYEVKEGSRFKVVAYDRAATAIEHATSEVKDLWDDGKLTTLPGVGAGIASHLDELFRKGRVKHFEQTMKGLPPAMFEFLDIPGVGAKTAHKLCQKLNINDPKTALVKLEKAAIAGKIRQIEGFGEESEKDILEAIKERGRREERMLLPFAWELAKKVIVYMEERKVGERVDPLGSLRRMAATVGDVDLAIATNQPKQAIEHFVKFPQAKEVLASGANTARIIHRSGRQVDLKTMRPNSYGALLQHFTGSKQHNIHLREIAQKRGLSLSEYGIKVKGKTVKCATEEEFYHRLGMEWIPPELREDTGEIEAAQQGKLPKLVKLSEIKGDLHVHSDFPLEPSHDVGKSSMREMVEKAIELGYEYLGFSEHNPSVSRHSKKQIIDLIKKKKDKVEQLKYSHSKGTRSSKKRLINLMNGLEIDIRPNGELALPKKAFELLDFVIVSVHSSFKMSREKMTERVLSAMEHPKVKILGHPTGRKLGQREGYELDWDKIFDFCKKKQRFLEINAWPDRLDLPDVLVREAVKIGVKMVICTDSHEAGHMDLMEYGVSVARRGWAEKKDILNILPYDKMIKELKGGEK